MVNTNYSFNHLGIEDHDWPNYGELSDSGQLREALLPALPTPGSVSIYYQPLGPQSTVHGPQSTVHGPQSIVHGPQSTVHGARSTVHGPRSIVHGPQYTVHSPQSTLPWGCFALPRMIKIVIFQDLRDGGAGFPVIFGLRGLCPE